MWTAVRFSKAVESFVHLWARSFLVQRAHISRVRIIVIRLAPIMVTHRFTEIFVEDAGRYPQFLVTSSFTTISVDYELQFYSILWTRF